MSDKPNITLDIEAPSDCRVHAEIESDAAPTAAPAEESSASPWRDMASAPRDGSYILAKVGGASDRWEHLNGRSFVIRHEGKTPSGFDLGWSGYPGFGGATDDWFTGWMPLPQTEARSFYADWQPIETAPKDGTPVDLWTRNGGRFTNVRWVTGAEVDPVDCGPGGKWEHLAMTGWRSPAWMTPGNGCGCLDPDQFTHWMPLPTPPKAEGE